jgi:manganese-dependent ADP-ribose/CDP-alcohol diphosphatase
MVLIRVQMAWLQDVLRKSVKAGEKVVVIGHHPIAPLNMYNACNYEVLIKCWSPPEMWLPISTVIHEGNYAEKNGIYYVNFKGMVETADTNAYSIVRVHPNRLEIKGYGREPNRVLKIGKKNNEENGKEIQHA